MIGAKATRTAFERAFFLDEEGERGYTTTGMAVALLVTLSLVFAGAQVYRLNTRSAAIQDVADASALAAESQVGQFMVVVRVCDAIVLSLSLTSLVVTGLGVAALCTPVSASYGTRILEAGHDLSQARDSFSRSVTSSLTALEKALPFLAAASALNVAQKNNDTAGDASYFALAVLVPSEGEVTGLGDSDEIKDAQEAVDAQADDLEEKGRIAEEAAQQASEAKHRAFMADCGNNPAYCMYERAASLAGLSGSENPFYSQEELWTFSVALDRTRAYYRARLRQEEPDEWSIAGQARSAMRKNMYRYACTLMEQAYVHESDDSFDAYFPTLPRNTEEMRSTPLYTEAVYPVTVNSEGKEVMHAFEGCPSASGFMRLGSVQEAEAGDFEKCPDCGFDADSIGEVCSASSSINNGYERHYRTVAQAAEDYEKARDTADPANAEVKDEATSLLERIKSALLAVKDARIDAEPAGAMGVIVLVVDSSQVRADDGWGTSFVQTDATLGTRAAVSGATLLADASDSQSSVITQVIDGIRDEGGVAVGALSAVLECWNGCLYAYVSGQDAISDGIKQAINQIPFASESGLGKWASKKFVSMLEDVGLQKPELDALKPVLVNTGLVANEDEGGFSVRYLSVKRATEAAIGGTEVFSSAISEAEAVIIETLSGDIELATIKPLGDWGPSIPITIVLPPETQTTTTSAIEQAADELRSALPRIGGENEWR